MAKQNAGSTPKFRTSAEDERDRRAAKARQKRTSKPVSANAGFYAGLIAERAEEARQRRETDQQNRQARAWEFSHDQAVLAEQHPWYGQLKTGTAKKFADLILKEFPLAQKTSEKSKTQVAFELALGKMSYSEVVQEKAITHGGNVARKALAWAFGQLKAAEKPQTAMAQAMAEATV